MESRADLAIVPLQMYSASRRGAHEFSRPASREWSWRSKAQLSPALWNDCVM